MAAMRLLLLTPEYRGFGGGIMTFYQQVVPALVRAGVRVRVIEGSAVSADAEAGRVLLDGVVVERLEQRRVARWWHLFHGLDAMPTVRGHLAAAWAAWEQSDFGGDADIVEACDWGLLFVPPAVEATRPVIVQCHASGGQIAAHDPIRGERAQDGMMQMIERAIVARARSIQTYSRANAYFWEAESGRHVNVIRPAWAPLSSEESQSVGSRGLVVGRVQRWKGPHVVCAALRRLGPQAPELDWFGRDVPWGHRQSSSISHLAAAFPDIWGTKLLHHASIPAAEVAQRQARALFNLVPSTWDVFNFTVVEAMASGRPAVVSMGAGASDLVEDGVSGFLFPAGDDEALAATIQRVVRASPLRLAEIGKAAQETVRTYLDPDRIAAERIAAYRAAVDDFRSNPSEPTAGWLGDICRPSRQETQESMEFLDQHPLRSILSYSMRRLGRRLTTS